MNKSFFYRILFFFILFAGFINNLHAQGELVKDDQIFYDNERTYSLSLISNGYGFNYRYAKWKDGYHKKLYDFDFVEIKSPKELLQSNPYIQNSTNYAYGKLNQFYVIRGGLGLQKEMFGKMDKGSVSIRYYYSYGLSLGLLKPVYYEVITNIYTGDTQDFKFRDIVQKELIVGRASYFKGFSEMTATPGIFVKYGWTFEYGDKLSKFRAFEAGVIVDAFLIRPEIMDTSDNNFVFLSLFASWRFGKVIEKH